MPMKIVTINIPDQYLDCTEALVNMGFFPSRSEVVREALKQFLTNDAAFTKGINPETFATMKKAQMEKMLH